MWRTWLIEKLGGYPTKESVFDTLEGEAAAYLIQELGGFATIEDAIEAIREKDSKERNAILTMAVKKLFNTIGPDDILQPVSGGQWLLEGKPLNKNQVELLMTEAAQLENTLLWKVLRKDVLYQANKKMYLLAENDMQVVTAKFWLYTFDVMRTRMKSIAAGSALFNTKEKK